MSDLSVLKKQKSKTGRCVHHQENSTEAVEANKLSPVSGNTGRMPLVYLYLNMMRNIK